MDIPASSDGGLLLFKLNLKINLEAGQYSLMVNLGHVNIGPNQGTVLAETPWLGPLTITWDYGSTIAPFYGMFGLPAQASIPECVTDPLLKSWAQ